MEDYFMMHWILLVITVVLAVVASYWNFYIELDISVQPEVIRNPIFKSLLALCSFLSIVFLIINFFEEGPKFGIGMLVIAVIIFWYNRGRLRKNLVKDYANIGESKYTYSKDSEIRNPIDRYDRASKNIENTKNEVEKWLTNKNLKDNNKHSDKVRLEYVKEDNWYVYYDVYIENEKLKDKGVKIDKKTFTVWENYQSDWTSHYKLD